ncbi:DMT family transporter [Pseudotenacibaculum sp. MALMAid0570]|uniref:DMT family transporter n=1 Tax=Pseudotenacibaculum sp. MALMAid0570 TaxID=3143938 RepID=UPI0032DFF7D5
MNSKILKAHLALLGANLIYGANHIIAKGIMPHKIGASAFVFLRIVGAGILFWLLKTFIKERVAKKDLRRLLICGLLGVATNQLLFFHGLNLTSPIDASIIITAVPILVLVFSFFILKEKITSNKILGVTIGAIGAVLLISTGNSADGTSSLLGNLFVFLNACCYGLYLVLVKPLMKKYNTITVVSWAFLFGFIFMFPIGIEDVISTDFESFTLHTYLTVAFVIIGTTFLAYLLNTYSLNNVSPSVNGSYIYLQPAISFIMVSIYAYWLGHEQYKEDIGWIKIVSCLLVFLGVFLVSKQSKRT